MASWAEGLRTRLQSRPVQAVNLPGLSLRESAVLVPLFERDGALHTVFTRRPMTLRKHAGQISFPGGSRDPQDPTPLHAALRELHEELGVPPQQVEVLGALDEVPVVTGFRIAPFVGRIEPGFPYAPSLEEVAEVIELPLSALAEPGRLRTELREWQGAQHEVLFYEYGPYVVWGATARIVQDLLLRMGDLAR